MKIKFLNKYGTTDRTHIKSFLTAKEHCVKLCTSTQWESFDQLSRMKMLNITRAYTTAKQKKLRNVIKETNGDQGRYLSFSA